MLRARPGRKQFRVLGAWMETGVTSTCCSLAPGDSPEPADRDRGQSLARSARGWLPLPRRVHGARSEAWGGCRPLSGRPGRAEDRGERPRSRSLLQGRPSGARRSARDQAPHRSDSILRPPRGKQRWGERRAACTQTAGVPVGPSTPVSTPVSLSRGRSAPPGRRLLPLPDMLGLGHPAV